MNAPIPAFPGPHRGGSPSRTAAVEPTFTARPSLRDIAKAVGCHYSTVSLALRGNPSIPETTRARIRLIAEQLGYRPDAMLAALSAYRIAKHPPQSRPVLAWCTNYTTRNLWRDSSCKCHYYDGAHQRAEDRGYTLSHFWLREPGMTGARMSAILRHRGIRGVLLAPQPQACAVELEWEDFSAVTIGYTLLSPKLHLIYHHDYRMMTALLGKLAERDYRRIGLVELREHDSRSEHNWLAAYLAAQHSGEIAGALPPLILESWNEQAVLQWVGTHRPDVIVTKLQPLKACLEQAGYRVPDEIGLAFHSSVDLPGSGNLSGMKKNAFAVGAMAVDCLIDMLHRNEVGIPALAQRRLIEGLWEEGATLRPQRTGLRRSHPATVVAA